MCRKRKLCLVVIALLAAIGLFSAFLHHHSNGKETNQCSICHLVKQMSCLFAAAAAFFLFEPSRKFFRPALVRSASLLFPSEPQGRSPPFLP